MEKHNTPTPWTISELNDAIDGEEDILIEHEGFPILTVRGSNDMSCIEDDELESTNQMVIDNAELIVKAVNAFSETQELLKDIRRHGLIEKDGYESLVKRLGKMINE